MNERETEEYQQSNVSPKPTCKTPAGKTQQNPFCKRILLRTWLVTAIFLFAAGIVLLIFGAIYWKNSVGIFLGGALCLVLAVPVTAFYFWYTRCYSDNQKTPQHLESKQPSMEKDVSTVGTPDLYKQSSTAPKTESPSIPHVVMTPVMSLQKADENGRISRDTSTSRDPESNKSSLTSTPDILGRRFLLNKNNLAPLASAETLTPSLRSSFASISNAI
ncbi:uncharacterized protein LOC111084990 [Limulus polyphemus]|uniref:Uncharacterized protein LOC111084990 n=1 Tax=Limulus polyphemus TaxID=6850 RepID=A0ABM1S1K9_LIMPO|nr:uncharacterized protein LOC111084990 [Limulus polyphemus]XP_022237515.1 uncharacterized protein LOC111084990 [Limulus polyphemus]